MKTVCPHCQKPVADALQFQKKHKQVAASILNKIDRQGNDMRNNINARLHLVPMFVAKVTAHSGMTLAELTSEARRREFVQVRHALMWFLAENTTLALVTIAHIFNRHHTSVIHARKAIPKLLGVGDRDTVATVDMVIEHATEIWKPTKNQTT